jgi:hypothetical protein
MNLVGFEDKLPSWTTYGLADIYSASAYTAEDFFSAPHISAGEMLVEVDDPVAGPRKYARTPYTCPPLTISRERHLRDRASIPCPVCATCWASLGRRLSAFLIKAWSRSGGIGGRLARYTHMRWRAIAPHRRITYLPLSTDPALQGPLPNELGRSPRIGASLRSAPV